MAAATAFLDSVQGQMTDALFWDVMGPLYTCDPTERIGAQGDGGALASTPCARPSRLLRIERRRSQRVCVSFYLHTGTEICGMSTECARRQGNEKGERRLSIIPMRPEV